MDDPTLLESTVGTARHHHDEGQKKYYDWVRTCLTVASGALTLLVALQGGFIPTSPKLIWALQLSWGCFGLTVVAALVVLYGESAMHFTAVNRAMSSEFVTMLQRGNPVEIGMWTVDGPWYCRVSQWIFPWSFALSFLFLALFAIVNVGHHTP